MNTNEMWEIKELLDVVLRITAMFPRYAETEKEVDNAKALLDVQSKLLKKLDELVDKAGS